MNYLKYTAYVYLLLSIIFFTLALVDWNTKGGIPWFNLGASLLALFMFFFRKSYFKKMENRNKKP